MIETIKKVTLVIATIANVGFLLMLILAVTTEIKFKDYDLFFIIGVWLGFTIVWLIAGSLKEDEYGIFIKDKFQFWSCIVILIMLFSLIFIL